MQIKKQSVALNILSNMMDLDKTLETINDNFNKGLIDEFTAESAFEQIEVLEKAMGHKYYKREGSPGKYKYYYTEAEYNKAKGKKTEEKKDKQSSFDWNSENAKNLAKFGVTKDNLIVNGRMDLNGSPITSLPEGLRVEGYLSLMGSQITSLPEGLKVSGNLGLGGRPITSLPEGLEVGGDLYLSHTKVTSLPEGLKVGGDLHLSHTEITSLPENLKVGGDLTLTGTKITQSDFKDSMEIGGTIHLDPKSKFKFKFA